MHAQLGLRLAVCFDWTRSCRGWTANLQYAPSYVLLDFLILFLLLVTVEELEDIYQLSRLK